MKPIVKQLYFLCMLVVAFFATAYMLSNIFLYPSTIILEIGGDTMKNYFSFLQHSTEGNGMHFTGMNYPYGENIVYADGQPILSLLLQFFQPLTYLDVLMVLHRAITLGFFLAIVYSYKILVQFRVHPIVAIVGAVLLSIMSPQIFRLFGHFGLSYLCAIPMLFYWSIKYHKTGKYYNLIFILIAGCILSFAHPYYAALFFMWTVFYALGYALITKEKIIEKIKHIIPILVAGIAIVIFVKLVMHFTDSVTDRTTFPLGILTACTTYLEVFTSSVSPIWTYLLDNNIINTVGDQTEGIAYIGIVGIVVLLTSVITIIVTCIKKQKHFTLSNNADFSPLWLIIAAFAIILAHGAPFIWMEWLLDYVSIFRQFRSLGRFAWIYYYIATIYVIVILYRLYLKKQENGKIKTAILILLLPLIIWAWEAKSYIRYANDKMFASHMHYHNILNPIKLKVGWDDFLASQKYQSDNFQAIIELPFVHVGSEKLWLNGNKLWAMTLASQAALQLNLPIVNVNMSRTSWSQTFKQVKLVAGPFAAKPILQDITSNKPFLLIHWDDVPLDEDSKYLFSAADSIGVYEQCTVYALYPDRLKKIDRLYKDSVYTVVINQQTLDTCIGCNSNSYIIDHFDEDTTTEVLFGSGARDATNQKVGLIKSYQFDGTDSNITYEVSIWFRVNTLDYKSPIITLEVLDAEDRIIKNVMVEGKTSKDSYGELWLRANKYFVIPKAATTIRLMINEDQLKYYLALDELVIRPTHGLIISKQSIGNDIRVMANNHILDNK